MECISPPKSPLPEPLAVAFHPRFIRLPGDRDGILKSAATNTVPANRFSSAGSGFEFNVQDAQIPIADIHQNLSRLPARNPNGLPALQCPRRTFPRRGRNLRSLRGDNQYIAACFAQRRLLERADSDQRNSSLIGFKLRDANLLCRRTGGKWLRAVDRQARNDWGAEIAWIGLRLEQLDSNGAVRSRTLVARGMDIACALQSNLPIRIFLVHLRFSRNTDGDFLIPNREGNRVILMSVHRDGISGNDFHFKDIYVVVMKNKMMVRFLVHANDARQYLGRFLCRQNRWQETKN